MIHNGIQLSENATLTEVVNVLNELIGDYSSANPLSSIDESMFASISDANSIWVLSAGFLVFFMHAGFAMLETGSIQYKNAINVLFKNTGTIAITGVAYFILGFGFAFGTGNAGENSFSFIGRGNFALSDNDSSVSYLWFFEWAFAATSATIVSGAVAGRVLLLGYFVIAAYIAAFVYPVVSHWVWATGGFASMFTPKEDTLFGPEGCGMIDFAGSGVVHLTGGTAAFWAALATGPRIGRFGPGGVVNNIPPHNMALVCLGTLILWFGWYGFNCGSTLTINGASAAHVAVTTTLSASMAGVTGVFASRIIDNHYNLSNVLNCILGGLVAITAGCSAVDPWAALIIGAVACFVYYTGVKVTERIGIDDPVNAVAVHGFCGSWGCLAAGIFATPGNIAQSYSGRDCRGWETGLQFGTQLVMVLTIIGWVTLTTVPLFYSLKFLNCLRVSAEHEQAGLDHSEHGGQAAFIGSDHEPTKIHKVDDDSKRSQSIAEEGVARA